MSGSAMGEELGARGARSRALGVLLVRSRAVALAILPAAVAVVLLVGGATDRLSGGSWRAATWAVGVIAVLVLLFAFAVAAVITRARPALSPTVAVTERAAPDLYRLVRELADRLDVPVPSAIALTPDCDSWLEDRTHAAHGKDGAARSRAARSGTGMPPGRRRAAFRSKPGSKHGGSKESASQESGSQGGSSGGRGRRAPAAPVLVIGSPFLWWLRVAELRAVLAPVVAGTGPAAHPDIAAARRFVRGLDAAVAVASRPQGAVRRAVLVPVGWIARVLLRGCGEHAALMERGVAAAASERAQAVDYGLRIMAQEQVGLAYAGWDRLLTRVALPAWRMGRWPSRLDVGVVSALTELSRRDRLADGFTSRLGERPACDLLEEPGTIDEAASLLAARLFHGGPAEPGPDWSPVDWQQYPEEVVDRKWRTEAARLHRVLDGLGVRHPDGPGGPTLSRVMEHLTAGDPGQVGELLAAGISAELAREAAARAPRALAVAAATATREGQEPAGVPAAGSVDPWAAASASWGPEPLPLLLLQPPRTGRDLLADHVTAMVCCSAVDTAGAAPGLDWLDGPALLVGGERRADLGVQVLSLVEEGDAKPLRSWLVSVGVRPEKPVRLG